MPLNVGALDDALIERDQDERSSVLAKLGQPIRKRRVDAITPSEVPGIVVRHEQNELHLAVGVERRRALSVCVYADTSGAGAQGLGVGNGEVSRRPDTYRATAFGEPLFGSVNVAIGMLPPCAYSTMSLVPSSTIQTSPASSRIPPVGKLKPVSVP